MKAAPRTGCSLYLFLNQIKTTNIMIGFIIWIIGVVLAVKAVLEIMRWNVDGVKKLLVAILVLLTSWIGLAVYYFWGRENLPQMLK
jgi:hypothetical protein